MSRDATAAELIGEDRLFQNAYWKIQRLCWVGMGGVLIAALLGTFGAGGPWARRRVAADGAQIDYPRTMRWNAEDQIILHARAGADSQIALDLPADFATRLDVEAIAPEPDTRKTGQAGQRLFFRAMAGQSATIILRVRPRPPFGHYRATIGVRGSAALRIEPLILP